MSSILLEIVNTQQELSSFPISNTISIRTDKKIYPLALVNGVTLFNGNNLDFPLPDDMWARVFSVDNVLDTPKMSFTTVPEQGNPGYFITEISFSKALLVNTKYVLGFSKDLYSNCFIVTEHIRTGLGNISPFLSKRLVSGYGTYTIEILTTSVITESSNVVNIRIIDSDGIIRDRIVDLKDKDSTSINDGISIQMDGDLPYSAGDRWTIEVTEPSYLDTQRIQDIHTLDSSVPIKREEVDSRRITESDIVSFYNNSIWNPNPSPSNSYGNGASHGLSNIAPAPSVDVIVEYVSTHIAKLTFSEDMDFSTITADIKMSHAFGMSILAMLVTEPVGSKYLVTITRIDNRVLEVEIGPGDPLSVVNPQVVINVL